MGNDLRWGACQSGLHPPPFFFSNGKVLNWLHSAVGNYLSSDPALDKVDARGEGQTYLAETRRRLMNIYNISNAADGGRWDYTS